MAQPPSHAPYKPPEYALLPAAAPQGGRLFYTTDNFLIRSRRLICEISARGAWQWLCLFRLPRQ